MVLRSSFISLLLFGHYALSSATLIFDPYQFEPLCIANGRTFSRLLAYRYFARTSFSKIKSNPPFWAFHAFAQNRSASFGFCEQIRTAFDEALAAYQQIFSYPIRVLLEEKKGYFEDVTITSPTGFILRDGREQARKWHFENTELVISKSHHGVLINNKRLTTDLVVIEPRSGHEHVQKNLELFGNTYQGHMYLKATQETVQFINEVDIEAYVYSVVRFEGWPGWPLEVNKAFCIAIRTYLVAKVLEARKAGSAYHIKNTNIHQTYKGLHESLHLQQAIAQTRGLILTHDNKPIVAMFDSCCGGVIPAHTDVVDYAKAPYLKREYACDFCKPCKIYSWKREYHVDDVIDLLCSPERPIKKIRSMKVTKKDVAGLVQEVEIHADRAKYVLSGKEMYRRFSRIVSFCYSIEKRGTTITFSGRGYGHHVGMCQWGARRMVDHGYTFGQMLAFYYPGTQVMCLRHV